MHYMETGSPHGRYAVIDREKDGWRINLLAVEYDWAAASDRIGLLRLKPALR